MNNEIKEILDKLKETADYPKLNYSSYDKSYNETIDNVAMIKSFACKQLLDYITNLQQENERLKEDLIGQKNLAMGFSKTSHDYYQRIEKAVEYLDKHKIELSHSFDEPDCDYWIATNPQEIIDILNGRRDE